MRHYPNLKKDIEDFIQDISLQNTMQSVSKSEKNRGRTEKRTAFVTADIQWLEQRKEWKNLKCIGAVHTEFTTKKGTSSEWHYYISSRQLTAEEFLHHARMEWAIESMHWLLDVHIENKTVQQCLNMFRKAAINLIKRFKSSNNSKQAISHLMFECLLNYNMILKILNEN